jgi:hypothetical protein
MKCTKMGEWEDGKWEYSGEGELVQTILYARVELSQWNFLPLLVYAKILKENVEINI